MTIFLAIVFGWFNIGIVLLAIRLNGENFGPEIEQYVIWRKTAISEKNANAMFKRMFIWRAIFWPAYIPYIRERFYKRK